MAADGLDCLFLTSPAMALAFGSDNVSLTRIERAHGMPDGAPRWRVRGVNL